MWKGSNIPSRPTNQNRSSPPYRQHQNGLVERQWQSILAMSRNWLKSSMLPTKYWYFAVKRAVEISNIMPTKHKSKITTPYELVYNKKPDYRVLIPMFSIAYIRQHRQNNKDLDSWSSRSLKCILVGTCPQSDGLIFYHPPSKQTLTCRDGYRFDPHSPAGPKFSQQHEGDFDFTTKSALHNIHHAPTHELDSTAFLEIDNIYRKVNILDVPTDEDDQPYIVQDQTTGDIHEVLYDELLDHDPTEDAQKIQDSLQTPFPHLPCQHGSSTTPKQHYTYPITCKNQNKAFYSIKTTNGRSKQEEPRKETVLSF